VSYVIRTERAGAQSLVTDVQRAVWSVNASLPVANLRTLQDLFDQSLARTSFTLVMLGLAGGMALLIGVVGIYGAISYSVSQRTREIGIRVALGARRAALVRGVIAQGVGLALLGVGTGVAVALPVTRLLRSLLFDVSPLDPLTYFVVAIGLLATAALASAIPAVRATAVDPVTVLRAG
jgi:putative ABC transport system permease protein